MSEETKTAIVAPVQGEIEALQARVQELETQLQAVQGRLPDTWILSDNLLKRAFGVYGHYLLAALLIAVPIMACSFFMFFVLGILGVIFGNSYGY